MAKTTVDSKDQVFPTYSKIKNQIDELECFPTWEEILEFEYVRRSGKYNMFEFHNVQRYAYDSGLYNVVNWLQRCKDKKQSYTRLYDIALVHYIKLHGQRDKWISVDFEKNALVQELEAQQSQFQQKLQSIQEKLESLHQ